MLKRFKAMRGSIFNADRAYDAEYIFKHIYKLGMKPNIKQRNMLKGRLGEGRKRHKYRMKASKEFDEQTYHHRSMIEAIFEAEESNNHKLKTRFRTPRKMGPNNSNRMEPQNTKQNKMHKTTKNNSETNPTQLSDNLPLSYCNKAYQGYV